MRIISRLGFSKGWKNRSAIFQGLEKFRRIFPTLGKRDAAEDGNVGGAGDGLLVIALDGRVAAGRGVDEEDAEYAEARALEFAQREERVVDRAEAGARGDNDRERKLQKRGQT